MSAKSFFDLRPPHTAALHGRGVRRRCGAPQIDPASRPPSSVTLTATPLRRPLLKRSAWLTARNQGPEGLARGCGGRDCGAPH